MKDIEMADSGKLNITRDNDENGNLNATYAFNGEDHTLGNLLRNILIKDPETQFCGYSIPHPSEDIMNVRIQSHKTHTDKVINKGLVRVSKICDILTDKFQSALNEYNHKKK